MGGLLPAWVRTDHLAQIGEQAGPVHQAEGRTIFVYNGSNSPGARGDRPGISQRGIWCGGIQPAGHGFEARRSVVQQHGRVQFQFLEHPGSLRIDGSGAGSDRVHAVSLAQAPGVAQSGGDGVGVGVDVSDHENAFHNYLSDLSSE